jgi:hypothetical protein
MNPKYPPGPPMTLGNIRQQGVQHLIELRSPQTPTFRFVHSLNKLCA